MRITFETSPSLWSCQDNHVRCDRGELLSLRWWNVIRCRTELRQRTKRDGHMITSVQTERRRAVIKTTFIRMKLVCVDYTFHAIYQKKISLCSVLITPSLFNLLKADIQWKAKQWCYWTPRVLLRHSLNRWPEAKVWLLGFFRYISSVLSHLWWLAAMKKIQQTIQTIQKTSLN